MKFLDQYQINSYHIFIETQPDLDSNSLRELFNPSI